MGIKLVVLDLDGTLLNNNKLISQKNLEALRKAHELGVWIVPSTGRFYKGMPQVVRELPFVRYAITINGAEIYDAEEDKTLYSAEIPSETADNVYAYMESLPVIYDCFQDGFGWSDAENYARIDEFISNPHTNKMVKETRHPIPQFRKEMLNRGRSVQKIQMFFKDMEKRTQILKEMPALFPELVVTSSITNNIEVNSPDATKGIALQKLCDILKINIEDTMAFGDGSNDISMLIAAGIGVAMENADPEVKDAANYITLTNEEDGVAAAFEKFIF